MITSRTIKIEDYNLLANSLLLDEYHKDTSPGFFYADGTVCSVFEDEKGIVLFARGKFLEGGFIALDIQFLNNQDAKRNMRTMLEGFPIVEKRAKEKGFLGFIFESQVLLLRKFCVRRLGFKEHNEYLLYKEI